MHNSELENVTPSKAGGSAVEVAYSKEDPTAVLVLGLHLLRFVFAAAVSILQAILVCFTFDFAFDFIFFGLCLSFLLLVVQEQARRCTHTVLNQRDLCFAGVGLLILGFSGLCDLLGDGAFDLHWWLLLLGSNHGLFKQIFHFHQNFQQAWESRSSISSCLCVDPCRLGRLECNFVSAGRHRPPLPHHKEISDMARVVLHLLQPPGLAWCQERANNTRQQVSTYAQCPVQLYVHDEQPGSSWLPPSLRLLI